MAIGIRLCDAFQYVFNNLIRLNTPCHVEPVSVTNMLSNYLLTELKPVRFQRESLKEIRWGGVCPTGLF